MPKLILGQTVQQERDVSEAGTKKAEARKGMKKDTSKASVMSDYMPATASDAKDRQMYVYALILIISGFSGDKLLKAVSDRVSSRLFTEAEKTRTAN